MCVTASADPEVRVVVIEPLPKASEVVKAMTEEEVTLLITAEVAGVSNEKVGAVLSKLTEPVPLVTVVPSLLELSWNALTL